MNSFPLFNRLLTETEKLKETELSTQQKKSFTKKIESINKEGIELIYALICSFQEYNNEKKTFIPYDGKYIENDITFDFEFLPIHLTQIIYKFVLMHTKRMEDENKRFTIEKN
jgi:hypothetical protein